MSWTREAVWEALKTTLRANIDAADIKTITRRMPPSANRNNAEGPWLWISEEGEDATQDKGSPRLDVLVGSMWLMINAGASPKRVRSALINDLLDVVAEALAPSPVTHFQDLGGLVSHAWVSGRTEIFEGLATDDLCGARIPINILVGRDNDGSASGFVFDSGYLVATLKSNAPEGAVTTPTPVILGALKSIRVEGVREINYVRADSLRYAFKPTETGHRVHATARFAVLDSVVASQLFWSSDKAAGATLSDFYRTYTVPASPYQVTVAPPSSGTFLQDLGVKAADGSTLTRVAGAPAVATEYRVVGAVYTFHADIEGDDVFISYLYTTATGEKVVIENKLRGYAATFQAVLRGTYNGRQMTLVLDRCVTTLAGLPLALEAFMVQDLAFEAVAVTDGNVGTISVA